MTSLKGALTIQGLHKTLARRNVLNDLSWVVERNTRVGLVGPNGSGKTTLLKVIAGFSLFDSGVVTVLDQRLDGRRHRIPSGIGVALEACSMLPQFTGLANLTLLARLSGSDVQEAGAALERVGLDPGDKRRVREYSLGMRQRLNLAQALMGTPAMLLLDEPTNGLDTEGLELFSEICRNLQDSTVVMATHQLDIAKELCDQIWLLSEGKVILQSERTAVR